MDNRAFTSRWGRVGTLLALTFAMAACGGGGGGGGSGGAAPDTASNGVSYGRITGFGSVFVNGTEFETGNAQILVDGVPATQAQLSKGMLVRVDGAWNGQGGGQAVSIEFDENLRGEVAAVTSPDPATGEGSLTVLGQTVLFDGRTVFRGKAANQVTAGDTVSVSGWYQGNGRFRASLIRVGVPVDANAQAELEGVIKTLNSGTRTFFIGGLKIDYNNAVVELEEGQTALAEGDHVEVEGQVSAGVLMASEVDAEDDRLGASEGDDVALEGPISVLNADGSVMINGVTVRLAGDVELDDGLSVGALKEGLYIKVEGEWNSAGEVVAEEIESRDADAQVDAAVLGAPDQANRRLDVGGVTVQVTDLTLIINDDDSAAGNLTFNDLKEGDALEVDGLRRTDADGKVYIEALKIERDQDDHDAVFELEGRVSAIGANSVTALGVVLNVDAATVYQDGLSGLSSLAVGNVVEVEYTRKDGSWFLAGRVERDD